MFISFAAAKLLQTAFSLKFCQSRALDMGLGKVMVSHLLLRTSSGSWRRLFLSDLCILQEHPSVALLSLSKYSLS